jgi:hypothetical protein
MAKFKTKGGKTVVIGVEAIGINDPLLGAGMAQGGKRLRKSQRKSERKKKHEQMERALRNSLGGKTLSEARKSAGPAARSSFDPSRPLRYQEGRAQMKIGIARRKRAAAGKKK